VKSRSSLLPGSRSSSGGVATRQQAALSGDRVPVGFRDFCFLQNFQTGSEGTPSLLCKGTDVPCLGVKRLGREFNHSPPSSADVKNEWRYTSVPSLFTSSRFGHGKLYLFVCCSSYLFEILWLFIVTKLMRLQLSLFLSHELCNSPLNMQHTEKNSILVGSDDVCACYTY
jgi:hypothetical protein